MEGLSDGLSSEPGFTCRPHVHLRGRPPQKNREADISPPIVQHDDTTGIYEQEIRDQDDGTVYLCDRSLYGMNPTGAAVADLSLTLLAHFTEQDRDDH